MSQPKLAVIVQEKISEHSTVSVVATLSSDSKVITGFGLRTQVWAGYTQYEMLEKYGDLRSVMKAYKELVECSR